MTESEICPVTVETGRPEFTSRSIEISGEEVVPITSFTPVRRKSLSYSIANVLAYEVSASSVLEEMWRASTYSHERVPEGPEAVLLAVTEVVLS